MHISAFVFARSSRPGRQGRATQLPVGPRRRRLFGVVMASSAAISRAQALRPGNAELRRRARC